MHLLVAVFQNPAASFPDFTPLCARQMTEQKIDTLEKELDTALDEQVQSDESHWTSVCAKNPEYQGCKVYEV